MTYAKQTPLPRVKSGYKSLSLKDTIQSIIEKNAMTEVLPEFTECQQNQIRDEN